MRNNYGQGMVLPSARNLAITLMVKKPHSFHLEAINHDKDRHQPIPFCLNKSYILLPAYIGKYIYKREDCVKNHMAESHELYQKCRHYLENQKIKKMKLLKLRKVFFYV